MPPINLLIKPASGNCNMRCRYCFYADEAQNRETPSMGIMSRELMHTIIDKSFDYADGSLTIAFQGGEPSLAGLDFFQDMTDYVKAHANPKNLRIQYAFQTNGYNLNDDWMKWFAENHVLVGVSLDGPREIHDRHRVDASGKGTFHRVTESIRRMEQFGVDYNILTVVTAANARHARQVYEFFKKNNYGWQQYIECLDPLGEVPGGHDYSLTPERYERFLKDLFDAWYQDFKQGRIVYNRYFENLVMIMIGQGPESCNLRGCCSPQWVIEANGNTYPCDFYALDEWLLGNIATDSFEEMERKRQASGFIQWSMQIPEECKQCKWFGLCRNGCRRHREPVTADSTNKNYFCTAYKGFFEYAWPRLQEMYRIVMQNRR